MLMTCTGCNSKIRAPDDAAGKQVKCPKCQTIVRVPAAPEENPEGVTAAPPPAAPPPEPADASAFSTTPTSTPNLFDRDDDDDAPRSHRRRDDDDDRDDFDVRDRRRSRPGAVNGMAMTSMILGIVSLVSVPGSCCCGLFWVVALVGSIVAIILGFLGKTPGSEGYAWTGIICGIVTLIALVVLTIVVIAFVGMDVALNQGRR